MPEQLTLRFDPGQHRTRSDVQVGIANRAAVELIDRWPDWPSRVVVLVGPEKSGKSHLAGILATDHATTALSAFAMDWEATVARLATARPSGLFIVEDTGPGVDEAGLFHLINAVQSADGYLLLTSRSAPVEWRVTLPDLASRLRAATPVVISAPEDALLEAIIAKHFADRQTRVDPAVIRYCVPRMERSYAAALDLVAQLDTAALTRKSAITRALAAEILAATSEPPLPGFEA